MMRENGILNKSLQLLLFVVLLVLINLLSNKWYSYIDLTEDKLFTLENSTKSLIEDVEQNVFIEVLLDGELNAGFIGLQNRVSEILAQFNKLNSRVEFSFTNPSKGSIEEINQRREIYRNEGIYPTTVFLFENDQRVEKLIYPYAIINLGDRRIPVNLLEPLARGETEEEAINRSSMLLEYKLSSTIAKLLQDEAPIILFTEGNGRVRG